MSDQPSRVIQQSDGSWYYTKRGERPEGPYTNRRSAEQALERYIHGCQVREAHGPLTINWPRQLEPIALLAARTQPLNRSVRLARNP